ncbi:MAG: Asp-tRNA(Asn)/Glu-tRNA(Gln) amidotransferase subunit GatC [Sulfolobales archaeon]
MDISVEKLERLAMLRLSKDEKDSLARDIAKILDFFRQLDEVELENIDPLFHVVKKGSTVREDITRPGINRSWVEGSAYRVVDGYVIGPRTIVGEEHESHQ